MCALLYGTGSTEGALFLRSELIVRAPLWASGASALSGYRSRLVGRCVGRRGRDGASCRHAEPGTCPLHGRKRHICWPRPPRLHPASESALLDDRSGSPRVTWQFESFCVRPFVVQWVRMLVPVAGRPLVRIPWSAERFSLLICPLSA